ncbi:MAG: tetratricopeptide repeat protein [Gammaproteobacteria bacterium]|nr:tetratricopeptide repeat protein [Gammaproteobacteria bacterium]
MLRILKFIAVSLFAFNATAENTIDKAPVLKDIFYGESLFYAFQDKHFDAISKLDAELGQYYALDNPSLDPFNQHINHAEFSVGSFELAYRMHQRAGRAIKSIMESNLNQEIRNEAAYRLAQIFYRKNQPGNALDILEKIQGEMADELRVDEIHLRAQVYISTGKFAEAIELLKTIENEDKYKGYILYNLGIAYIQNGDEKKAIEALGRLGVLSSDDRGILALKDKANLTLASRMLEKGSPELAKKYFSLVRLNGPFADRALLGMGWVNVSLGQFKKALVPWGILQEREITNESVQESLLAVPYAYGQLNYFGQAALSYGKAMDNFGGEIDRLQTSIKSVREGKFLSAVLDKQAERDKNWLHNLRDLQETPETRYILSLMASNDFQQSLQNYKDLAELRVRLSYWLSSLDVYVEMIEIRRRYYTPLLPVVEKQFKKLDARIRLRLSQRDRLDQRLKSLVIARRPEYLATAEERGIQDKLGKIELYLSANPQHYTDEVRARISRLKGVLHWNINKAYHERLTNAYKQMQTLDVYINKLNETYKSFVRTRQAATQSYEGYDIQIRQLKTKIQAIQLKVNGVMARQGRLIETLAVNELERRRNLLEEYQIKARFALAESYDRATKKQQKAEQEKLLQGIEEDKALQPATADEIDTEDAENTDSSKVTEEVVQ